ncbi:MAG: hypothetical protein MUF38_08105 [Anaerolineae bacterium]|nr:hypothetical protein [Anaerolineae bacterium]
MKKVLSLLVLVVLSAVVVLAQDDAGSPNNPASNERANACYTGGSLEGKCDWPTEAETEWAWTCGWYIIRAEANPTSYVPATCNFFVEIIDDGGGIDLDNPAGLVCESIEGFNGDVGFFPMTRCVGAYIAYDDWYEDGTNEYYYRFGDFEAGCPAKDGYLTFSGPSPIEMTGFSPMVYPQVLGAYMCTYELPKK